MFYAHIVLAKKGPLARIWLAAHWDKKLTKAHVFETDIEQSVEGIMQPKVKLALRTSGHLLLGVVRIYSRKAKYLLADCNEAFVKIKMAFRPGMVDLPEEHREAAVNAITLPEVFHDFDTALPELNDVDIEAQFSINQSRADEITMREDYGSLSMSIHDDDFGDMGFDAPTPDLVRDGMDPNIDESLFAEELGKELDQTKAPIPGTSRDILDDDLADPHIGDEGFGDEPGQPAAGLFEGDIFGEAPLPQPDDIGIEQRGGDLSDDDMDHFDNGAPSPMGSSIGSRPPTPLAPQQTGGAASERFRAPSVLQSMSPHHGADIEGTRTADDLLKVNEDDVDNVAAAPAEQTTLLNNDEESFALAPVDASAYKGVTKTKRKRKLIVDEIKNISGEEMKSQLANTSDIVTTLDLAPPTKRLMFWKETGGVEKLFALPSRDIPARFLFKNYQRHLSSRSFGVEDFSVLGPADILAIDQVHETESPTVGRRGRKRKVVEQPEIPAVITATETPETSGVIPEVEQARDGPEASRISAISLDTCGDIDNNSLMPPPSSVIFDPIQSPAQFPLLGLGSMTPNLPNITMTPGNLSHGDDLHDDFHHSGLTPADLHHGDMTPHHPGIENIPSMPNLPADQVTSILNAAEGIGDNLDYDDLNYPVDVHDTGKDPSSELVSDWNEEYDFPQSVGYHQTGDEQMENETDEQFEERVLNKRAAQMFVAVRHRMQKKDHIYLSELTQKNHRKQAAQKFYSLLVLKKFRALEIAQNTSYGDILVTKGPMFDNPKL